jgi:hypothetical protein
VTSIDVATWLRGLGLEQYAPVFRDNEIDAAVLPELTVDLARLWAETGHRAEAQELLAPVYNWGSIEFRMGDVARGKRLGASA